MLRRGYLWVAAAALSLVATACANGAPAALQPPPTDVAIRRQSAGIEAFDNYFAPKILRGAPGAKVFLILRNGGYRTHNVTIPDLHFSKDVPPGDIRYAQARFPAKGVIAFYCRFHRTSSGMIGSLEADPSIAAPK